MEVIDKNEYISKLEAVQILQKAYVDGRIQAKDGCVSLLDDINAMPSADVQPVKHSHWFYPFSELDVNRCWECGFYVQDKINNVREMFHYCPRCGAKMDGDK